MDGHGESITPNATVKNIGRENNTSAAAAINQKKYYSKAHTARYYTTHTPHKQNVATALQICCFCC